MHNFKRAKLLFWLTASFFLAFGLWHSGKPVGNSTNVQAADTFTVKASHPRLWLTTDRLAQLKDYASRNGGKGTTEWQTVKSVADAQIQGTNCGYPGCNASTWLPILGLAYQVTGDTKYADKGIDIMVNHIAIPTDTQTADSYFGYRSVIPETAAGYDWLYDRMTTAQRQQVATWLMDRADAVWPETNPARSSGWAVNDPGNNYYWGFMMTWPAALAVYGDGTDTGTGAYSGTNRPLFHINLALNRYRNQFIPQIANKYGRGGLFMESTNYDSTFNLGLILDAHKTATGQDLANEPGMTFMRDSVYWRIMSTTPLANQVYPNGNQTRISSGPISEYDIERMFMGQYDTNDTTTKQYAQYWLQHMNPDSSQVNWRWESGWRLLFMDPDLQAVDYTKTLPFYRFFEGPGMEIRRGDWTQAATYWGFQSGPLNQGHQNQDENGFMVYKNGWLLSTAEIYSHGGTEYQTPYFNNYTFGGLGQTWQTPSSTWPDEAGNMVKREDANTYTYLAGQAAQAYVQDRSHSGTAIANDYTRKYVYLPGSDQFIIYDRVDLIDPKTPSIANNSLIKLDKPSEPKEMHLQAKNAFNVTGRFYATDNGTYRLFGQSLLPLTGVTVTNEPLHLENDPTIVTSNRLNIVADNSQNKEYLMNVLQITPESQTAPAATSLVSVASGNHDGVRVGKNVVLLGRTEAVAGKIAYTTGAGTDAHYVFDLSPNTAYTLTVKDGSGATVQTANLTASSLGTVTFKNQSSGGTSFTLEPGTSSGQADISLAKSVDHATGAPGDVLTYIIHYTNNGSAAASNTKISDIIPAGSSLVAGSISSGGSVNGSTISWTIPTIAPFASGSVSFKATVNP